MLKQIVSRPRVLAELAGEEVSVERLIEEFQLLGPSGSEPNQNETKLAAKQTTHVLHQDARIRSDSGEITRHEK